MRPLLLHGFGTALRVNGRTLEIAWRSEGRRESYSPQQLPFNSVVIDSLTGSVSFEAPGVLGIHDLPAALFRAPSAYVVKNRCPFSLPVRPIKFRGHRTNPSPNFKKIRSARDADRPGRDRLSSEVRAAPSSTFRQLARGSRGKSHGR